MARLGTSIGTICRDSPDKRWNKYCQRSQPGAARELPATAANFWLMGGAAPTPRLPRLRPRCPCYCSKFLANRSSRVARAWQPASQAGRPGSRQGSLGKSPGETRGQPWGRHDTYKPHPEAKATTLANSISGQPGVRCLQNKRSLSVQGAEDLLRPRGYMFLAREVSRRPPHPPGGQC